MLARLKFGMNYFRSLVQIINMKSMLGMILWWKRSNRIRNSWIL